MEFLFFGFFKFSNFFCQRSGLMVERLEECADDGERREEEVRV